MIPRNLARTTESKITVFGQPTLTGEYTLDGNGVLAFPLIGNIPADGSTTSELQQKIAAKLAPDYLVNPSVSAEIVTRRPFYVIGEVQKPGNYAYVTDMTALNAVAMAGGFTRRAKKNDFYVKRVGPDGKVVRIVAKSETGFGRAIPSKFAKGISDAVSDNSRKEYSIGRERPRHAECYF